MKLLAAQAPTPEQLRIIGETRPGIEIIRGAAGSGKTMTALLRLKNLTDMFTARHTRLSLTDPVKALVLTYNRTLAGYVAELAREQAAIRGNVSLDVDTFAHWASSRLGDPKVLSHRDSLIVPIASRLGLRLPQDFLLREVEYVLGRFPATRIIEYLDSDRTGRGLSPRMERPARELLLTVIEQYKAELARRGLLDWEDLASLIDSLDSMNYEIAIIDEAQDFSANQLRAVHHHLAPVSTLTLVLDTVQRLYPRGYTWAELELGNVRPRFHKLQQNHRNTVEIAHFTSSMLQGVPLDDDGALPDLSRASRRGPLPVIAVGLYNAQVRYAIHFIRTQVDLSSSSVAFLHPAGWFSFLRNALREEGLPFVEITREKDWPAGPANIALSTMHSAKGLEFDHVIILGLSPDVTQHGQGEDDEQLVTLRRLLGMAVARARETVTIGYKPGEMSDLLKYIKTGTYREISVD